MKAKKKFKNLRRRKLKFKKIREIIGKSRLKRKLKELDANPEMLAYVFQRVDKLRKIAKKLHSADSRKKLLRIMKKYGFSKKACNIILEYIAYTEVILDKSMMSYVSDFIRHIRKFTRVKLENLGKTMGII
ncbi:MAG: hypothetical protein WA055_01850 [Candidatus Moraniibacteriota bacterium]